MNIDDMKKKELLEYVNKEMQELSNHGDANSQIFQLPLDAPEGYYFCWKRDTEVKCLANPKSKYIPVPASFFPELPSFENIIVFPKPRLIPDCPEGLSSSFIFPHEYDSSESLILCIVQGVAEKLNLFPCFEEYIIKRQGRIMLSLRQLQELSHEIVTPLNEEDKNIKEKIDADIMAQFESIYEEEALKITRGEK